MLIKSTQTSFVTTTFYKNTYTGLLTNYFSFTPLKYKLSLVRTLIDRAFKVNSTWLHFHLNLVKIKSNLQKNSFPLHIIDRYIKSYLHKVYSDSETANNEGSVENDSRYYKLPYIGRYSDVAKLRLDKVVNKLCKEDTSIKLVFIPFKIGRLFSLKDSVTNVLKSNVVYKFSCAGCNACYVGETTRHFSTRIKEHLETDKNSHVHKHLLSSSDCKDKANTDCFSIIDSAPTKFQLKIKEGMHIEWLKPSLNKQVKNFTMTIVV